MSKFTVVDGDNVASIASNNREIRILELEIRKLEIERKLTDRDLVVYSYHFMRLNQPLLARTHLNRISATYFEAGVYRDLFQAMLQWSILRETPDLVSDKANRAYEYYILLRRTKVAFETLNFSTKASFEQFHKDLESLSKV